MPQAPNSPHQQKPSVPVKASGRSGSTGASKEPSLLAKLFASKKAETNSGKASSSPAAPKKRDSRIEQLKKQVGGFMFQLITLSLFLTIFGWWGYTQVMKQVLGRFDVLDWESATATLYGEPNVLLIDPVRTEEFLRPDTALHDTTFPYGPRIDDWPLLDTLWYAPGIPRHSREGFEAWNLLGTEEFKQAGMADPWKELLFRKKIAFNLAQEPALVDIPEGVNMIILPGTLLLSNEEKKASRTSLWRAAKFSSVGLPDVETSLANGLAIHFWSRSSAGRLPVW